ncbi:hypothetical protein AC806_05910 [Tetragenococcus halophilus]|nr:hypothetical protein AC806_05910 [Tetragenococcus halophilus]RQD32902.1 hypothetical protein C7K42_02855 [Tetragenococcus halophilus subsp. halophilus DSM 20339]
MIKYLPKTKALQRERIFLCKAFFILFPQELLSITTFLKKMILEFKKLELLCQTNSRFRKN